MMEAVQNQDWDVLEGATSEEWVLFGRAGAESLGELRQFFVDHITDHSISIRDVNVHISDDASLAWATFGQDAQYMLDGYPVEETAWFTAIYRNSDQGWKQIHLHRTVVAPMPEEMPEEI